MARFVIRGGKALVGNHVVPGNKNAALPMLAAAVLTDKPVRLANVPMIEDVTTMLSLLQLLGADVKVSGHTVTITAKALRRRTLDKALCSKARSSILFAGPLAARYGKAVLHPPGGDPIGRRPLDTHFQALSSLGIKVEGASRYTFSKNRFSGADILLDEASVTATENALMAATLAPGETTIFNAACEPHVQDLCHMLNMMGADISGIGTNFLRITGVSALNGVSYRLAPDLVNAASFMTAAALTGGNITMEEPDYRSFEPIARQFRRLGMVQDKSSGILRRPANGKLRIASDFASAIPKIDDGAWPGFPSDLMSVAIVLASQASGSVLFFEKMFESRMYFVDRLIEMGAKIVQCDPHRVVVHGPAHLRGIHMSGPDIRAGMALLIAALCAKGTSTIDNAQVIDRGYENVDVQLKKLGADIERTS